MCGDRLFVCLLFVSLFVDMCTKKHAHMCISESVQRCLQRSRIGGLGIREWVVVGFGIFSSPIPSGVSGSSSMNGL